MANFLKKWLKPCIKNESDLSLFVSVCGAAASIISLMVSLG